MDVRPRYVTTIRRLVTFDSCVLRLTAAQELYKHLLRNEKAAWDALFAVPIAPDALENWSRCTALANEARAAFLEPNLREGVADRARVGPSELAEKLLETAMLRHLEAWIAQESIGSGASMSESLRDAWRNAAREVRAARNLLRVQKNLQGSAIKRPPPEKRGPDESAWRLSTPDEPSQRSHRTENT